MNHAQLNSYDRPARATTAVWSDDMLGHHPRFAEVGMALLPASLILAAATALLVVLV